MYKVSASERTRVIALVASHPMVVSNPVRIFVWVAISNLYLNRDYYTRESLYKYNEIFKQQDTYKEGDITEAVMYFIEQGLFIYTEDVADGCSYFAVDSAKAVLFLFKRDTGEMVHVRRGEVDFSLWWNAYDKKVGSAAKLKRIWDRLSVKTQHLIMIHTAEYVKNTSDKKYRKNPQTYLNQQAWLDEIITSETKQVEHIPTAVITTPTTDVPDEVKQRYERLRGSAHG